VAQVAYGLIRYQWCCIGLVSVLPDEQGGVCATRFGLVNTKLRFGVPQGSVLGPLLFILCTAGLSDLIEGYGLNPHLYANDMQVQGSGRPGSANQLQSTLSACLNEVSDWMRSNCLHLNSAKTEILWCSTTRWQNHLPSGAVYVGENHVLPSTTVCDLGVLIDSDVVMRSRVAYDVRMFHCGTTAPQHQMFGVLFCVPFAGRVTGYATS